jgi:hypothetical protein
MYIYFQYLTIPYERIFNSYHYCDKKTNLKVGEIIPTLPIGSIRVFFLICRKLKSANIRNVGQFLKISLNLSLQIIHLNGCGPAPFNCNSKLSPNSTVGFNTNLFLELDVDVRPPFFIRNFDSFVSSC